MLATSHSTTTGIEPVTTLLVLEPIRKQLEAARFVLSRGEHRMGSSDDADFRLSLPGIAAQHAEIVVKGSEVHVTASDRRAWHNGGPILRSTKLRVGDELVIGPVSYRVAKANTDDIAAQAVSAGVGQTRQIASKVQAPSKSDTIETPQQSAPEIVATPPASRASDAAADNTESEIGQLDNLRNEIEYLAVEVANQHQESTQAKTVNSAITVDQKPAVGLQTLEQIQRKEALLNDLLQIVQRESEQVRHWQSDQQAKILILQEELNAEKQRHKIEQANLTTAKTELDESDRQFRLEQDSFRIQREELTAQEAQLTIQQNELENQLDQFRRQQAEFALLQAELTTTTEQFEIRQTRFQAQEKQLTAEREEIASNASQLSARHDELVTQQLEFKSLKEEFGTAVDEFDAQQIELRQQREQLADERDKLARQSDALLTQEKTLDLKELELNSEREQFQSEMTEWEQNRQTMADESSLLAERHQQLEVAARELRDREQVLKAERDKWQTECQKSQDEIEQQNSAIEKRLVNLEQHDAEITERSSALDASYAELSDRKTDLSKQLTALAELESNLTERQAEIAACETDVMARASQNEQQANELAEQRQHLELQTANLKQQQQQFETDKTRQAEEWAEQQSELTASSEIVEQARTQLDDERQLLESAQKELDAQRKELAEQLRELEQAGQAVAPKQQDIESLQNKLEAQQRELQEREQKLSEETTALKNQQEDAQAEKENLRKAREILDAQRLELEQQQRDLEARFTERPTTALSPDVNDDTDALPSALADYDDENSQLDCVFDNIDLEGDDSIDDREASHHVPADIDQHQPEVESASESDPVESLGLRSTLADMFGLSTDKLKHSTESHSAEVEESIDELTEELQNSSNGLEPTSQTADTSQSMADSTNGVDKDQSMNSQTPVAPEPAKEAAPEIVDDIDDPDSVQAYMQRLLNRNRKGGKDHVEPTPPKKQPAAAIPDVEPQLEPRQAMPEVSREDATVIYSDRSATADVSTVEPKHRQDKVQVRARMDSLREVANLSARTAIAQYGWEQMRGTVLTQAALAVASFGTAIVVVVVRLSQSQPIGSLAWVAAIVGCLMSYSLMKSWQKVKTPQNVELLAEDVDEDGNLITGQTMTDSEATNAEIDDEIAAHDGDACDKLIFDESAEQDGIADTNLLNPDAETSDADEESSER